MIWWFFSRSSERKNAHVNEIWTAWRIDGQYFYTINLIKNLKSTNRLLTIVGKAIVNNSCLSSLSFRKTDFSWNEYVCCLICSMCNTLSNFRTIFFYPLFDWCVRAQSWMLRERNNMFIFFAQNWHLWGPIIPFSYTSRTKSNKNTQWIQLNIDVIDKNVLKPYMCVGHQRKSCKRSLQIARLLLHALSFSFSKKIVYYNVLQFQPNKDAQNTNK